MNEFPTFEEFIADIPSRLHPVARARSMGAKAIELDGGRYYSWPFADAAKDSGKWLASTYTLGGLRKIHQRRSGEEWVRGIHNFVDDLRAATQSERMEMLAPVTQEIEERIRAGSLGEVGQAVEDQENK